MARKKQSTFEIVGQSPEPGTQTRINARIARLPSGTLIDMPVYVYRSKKKGPCVMLSGGLHGDEVNGIEIVRRMMSDGDLDDLVRGTVIAVPILNIFGFLNFSREVPDGKDVNRSFPGHATGSLASRVAHFLTHHVLPVVDVSVDFHTGGASRFNFPQVRYSSMDPKAAELAMAFAPPLVLQSAMIDKSMRKQLHKMNKTSIVFEGGESMRLDDEVVRQGTEGARRLLHHLDMVPDSLAPTAETIRCDKSSWVRAKRSGLYKGSIKAGSALYKNDVIGRITDPFGEFGVDVKSKVDGYVLGHNNMPVVNQGDALIHIGTKA